MATPGASDGKSSALHAIVRCLGAVGLVAASRGLAAIVGVDAEGDPALGVLLVAFTLEVLMMARNAMSASTLCTVLHRCKYVRTYLDRPGATLDHHVVHGTGLELSGLCWCCNDSAGRSRNDGSDESGELHLG